MWKPGQLPLCSKTNSHLWQDLLELWRKSDHEETCRRESHQKTRSLHLSEHQHMLHKIKHTVKILIPQPLRGLYQQSFDLWYCMYVLPFTFS